MKYIKTEFIFKDYKGEAIKDNALSQTCKDVLCSLAGEAGFESFEENGEGITGYAQKGQLDLNALDSIIEFFPMEGIHISYETEDAEDKNWNEEWENEGFEPILINGRCVIHDTIHPTPPSDDTPFIDITIDAKQAFGTGNHETTYMIVSELLDMEMEGKSVLDCGCGTGILSIVASKTGAKDVTGYDIDEWSVRNTMHNCTINNTGNVNVMHGDAGVLNSTSATFDVVIANINRNILLSDMPSFKKKMKENGVLILSGFYTEDAEILIKKAEELNLKAIKSKSRNNWCMLVFRSTGV